MVALDEAGEVVATSYRRHQANVPGALSDFVSELRERLGGDAEFALAITGSVGLGVTERLGVQFVQEVVAATEFTRRCHPEVRTLIDIGGEDAKIVYLTAGGKVTDLRMNGNCAGGTGAFIDQMALCLGVEIGDLDALAAHATQTYPIASRCGVFSKTDIQNLIARNVPKTDIAASIFRAVSVQTTSTLSHGCVIAPKILLCGGPLTFIPSLRAAMATQMGFDLAQDFVVEAHSEVIPAWGAALSAAGEKLLTADELEHLIAAAPAENPKESAAAYHNSTTIELPPIFESEDDYLAWKAGKADNFVPVVNVAEATERNFLGVDSGSTTTKIVVINERGEIIYKYYTHNSGNPIDAVRHGLEKLQERAAEEKVEVRISSSCSTGYGEDLIKAAFSLDHGMVETMAHYVAARSMCPEVSFILDIGGQDMKATYVDHGTLTRMELNEACSSGCGSFIETFAQTLGCDIGEFVLRACKSQRPSDLGTRCTVFMNSKVKQVLREGATVDDIAAGLAYSVVKNCLFKVLKLKNYQELGDNVVLQGGTMRNDAIVRAFEKLTGKTVYCNNVPELMGAYGCALEAAARCKTTDQSRARSLDDLLVAASFTDKRLNCKGCENQCVVTQYRFANGGVYYSGNKCEKVFTNQSKSAVPGQNMSLEKYKLLFETPPNEVEHPLLRIGIPRALNIYEELPYWRALFNNLGIQTVYSGPSMYSKYEKSVGTVMSDNICFPAKMVHSHIMDLDAREDIDRIFFPRVVYELEEDPSVTNSYNCPVIIGYPEVVASVLKTKHPVDSPVISFKSKKLVGKQLRSYLEQLGVDQKQIDAAHEAAWREAESFGGWLREMNSTVYEQALQEKRTIVLLAGRPYHTDPLIQHKVSEMIAQMGATVVTEEIVRNTHIEERESFILKQWTFVNRILNSAQWAARQGSNVHFVETTSFGCGPDAFFVDEVQSILNRHNKSLTLLKIDDINNVGSMRLRVRSLIESLKYSRQSEQAVRPFIRPRKFFAEDKKVRTILAPFFTEYISPLLAAAFKTEGYTVISLPQGDAVSNDLGLKYSNNEVCYPATLIVGDFIKALQSGKYDLDKTAVAVTQLGQCRATNYPSLIRKAIVDAGFAQVPVIGIAGTDKSDQPGFKLNLFKAAPIVLHSVFFGDWLSIFYHATAVREKVKGQSRALRDDFLRRANPIVERKDLKALLELTRQAAEEFNDIDVYTDRTYPKAGIAGEIFLKFNPYSHRYVPDWLMEHGVEVVPPTIHNFFLRGFVNYEFNKDHFVKEFKVPKLVMDMAYSLITKVQKKYDKAAQSFRYYEPEIDIKTQARLASEIISLSAQFGEGWLLPAEVIAYIKQGCKNVVSMQPFGCIANHIVVRGIEKRLKEVYPELNLLALDFDGGVSEANIANRLLLFLNNMERG